MELVYSEKEGKKIMEQCWFCGKFYSSKVKYVLHLFDVRKDIQTIIAVLKGEI